MKRTSVIIAILIGSLLLAGCSGGKPQTDVTDPFVGGTEGIAMSFQEGTPPREIFDNGDSTFSVGIRMQNNGESDVGPDSVVPAAGRWAQIQLIGINPIQFGSPQMTRTFSEEGITLTRMRKGFDGSLIAGTPDVMTFDGFHYLPSNVGNSQATIRAVLCYDYTTFTATPVCIKSNALETVQDNSICTLTGARDVKNSGAPVHVTTVSQAPLGKDKATGNTKIQVQFTIENVGTGMIFAPSDQTVSGNFVGDHCDPSQQNQYRDRVYVHVRLNDDQSNSLINCNRLSDGAEGMVQLFGGQPTMLTCTIQAPPGVGSQAYTDNLRIDVDYAYSQYIETPILIRSVSAGLN